MDKQNSCKPIQTKTVDKQNNEYQVRDSSKSTDKQNNECRKGESQQTKTIEEQNHDHHLSKSKIPNVKRRKGVVSLQNTNSLDWDSPSAKTGTVKRRPVSGTSSVAGYKLSDCDSGIASPLSPLSFVSLAGSLDASPENGNRIGERSHAYPRTGRREMTLNERIALHNSREEEKTKQQQLKSVCGRETDDLRLKDRQRLIQDTLSSCEDPYSGNCSCESVTFYEILYPRKGLLQSTVSTREICLSEDDRTREIDLGKDLVVNKIRGKANTSRRGTYDSRAHSQSPVRTSTRMRTFSDGGRELNEGNNVKSTSEISVAKRKQLNLKWKGKVDDEKLECYGTRTDCSCWGQRDNLWVIENGNCAYGARGERDVRLWDELERLRRCSCVDQQEQIYTDWANHYLEKARCKRRVTTLATDCSDGVLLADVIESVTNQKIPDINRKPKTPGQMLDNISSCVAVLRAQHVPGIEAISATDLREGRLKAVLALFFALSRHKQATKQQRAAALAATSQLQQQHPSGGQVVHTAATVAPHNTDTMTPHRQLAGAGKGNTSIPLPGSALPARRCPPDKVRPAPVPSTQGTAGSVTSSRASSPALSLIPRAPTGNSHSQIPQSPYHQNNTHQNKSMLDKLKLFKHQSDKNTASNQQPQPTSGKRTSSSSGVSSARSERSDSSTSLEPLTSDTKQARNLRNSKPRTTKTTSSKNSPNLNKKEQINVSSNKPSSKSELEKQAHKLANSPASKLTEPRVRVPPTSKLHSVSSQNISKQNEPHTNLPTKVPVVNNSSSISPLPTQPNSTGIPKPTAAVKGTSKLVKEDKNNPPVKPSPTMTHQNNISRENSLASISVSTSKQAIAMVSPMPSEGQSSQLSESSHSGSHSASTGHHSNSSESSVIYRPSSESGSDHPNTRAVIPNRKEPISYLDEADENKNEEPASSESAKAPDAENVNLNNAPKNTPTSKLVCHSRDGSLGDEENPASMNVQPMMPLTSVRGYCNNLTLPNRAATRQQYLQRKIPDGSEYCEIALANGYMSDGEVLRNPEKVRNEICDGYMSDGRTSTSAIGIRRIQQHSSQNILMAHGPPRVATGLTVLTEQSRPRGGRDHRTGDDGSALQQTPPPLGPRNGIQSQSGRPRRVDSSQQTANSQNAQWKRYTDSPGVGTPVAVQNSGQGAPSSPTQGRRERKGSPHSQSKEKNSTKVRGVPQSFGYVKRNSVGSNGTATPVGVGVGQASNSKTAQVSAVPRTKVKVSGGTQTCSSDLQQQQPHQSHHKTNPQYKSYSLTGNAASQLSQSVRERLMMGSQSLPKAAIGGHASHDYGLVMRQVRPKASDGSLSDTQAIDNTSPYAPWLRHSNTYSVAPRLAETDSMESLSSLPGHRGSLTHSRLLRDSSARLSRSNSIRSTKSEKLYPSMLHRGPEIEPEPYYCLPVGAIGSGLSHWSQPTSPAPGATGSPRMFPLSPTHGTPTRHGLPKNDDIHGSSVSLVSTASSLYSSAEEKQAHEIRKLRRELMDAQEKVHTLTSQLTTNAHVVSAFEQSLSSMTQRLQHLTQTAEKKDSELAELRAAMESLRAQSLQAGLSTGLARQPSSDSVSSMSSACSLDKTEKKKKKGWLRSSFTKAFSRNAKQTKVQSLSEGENTETPTQPINIPQALVDGSAEVEELQKQLREKDMVLTDIRLEALSSAHQLESLKDTVMKMRSEMLSLKQNNERLQRMVGGSLPVDISDHDSISEPPPDVIAVDDNSIEPETDGKRITISVYLGQPQTFDRYYSEHYGSDGSHSAPEGYEIAVAFKNIGASMSWAQLDGIVRRAFKQHVARIDPGSCLGLGSDSIARYCLGEAERSPESQPPDLLPVGYAVGRVSTLHVILQPVCALAFEALIPRGVAQRLVSLLAEHRRLVLCGPPGTGKTHLANRLADFHAQSQGRDPADAVATFNVDHKSGKELRQYLAHLGEQAAAGDSAVLPCVVVLDNLHCAGPLGEALGSLPRALPCLVGTMAQAACSTTSLQLQHGFRWVLVAPHMEPASGLLGRVLRRRLSILELTQGERPELAAVLGWLPRVWRHLNKFLETHSSGDVAIGPRLFLACPLDLDAAKAWFSDVWNYSLAPYLREAAREGLQLYGKRAAWVDPSQFVLETYPWPGSPPQNLTRIGPHDVGLESSSSTQQDCDSDPLLNMLMRLQEAANYSSPHSNDSDCASLDSNLTHESSIGTESVL